jgi:4-amino-4-deoxychorismate lyase
MYWYDGQLVDSQQIKLNLNAPELCYGATVFTTMRVYKKSLSHELTYWQEHCDRLMLSLKAFNWQQPNWDRLRQGALELLAHFPVLRMVILPNGTEWITGRGLPPDLKLRQAQGIVAWVATDDLYQRELPQHKTGNYLGTYLARNQALSFKAQEAILVDHQGNWLETSTGNLWGWRDGCWYTPNSAGILPGIKRSHLLKLLPANQVSVQENLWTPEFVETLEAISYSNCVVEIIPIKQILSLGKSKNYPLVNFPLN